MTDYYLLLAVNIAGLMDATPQRRETVYQRAREAMIDRLNALSPALPDDEIEAEYAAFDAAVARLENELSLTPAPFAPLPRAAARPRTAQQAKAPARRPPAPSAVAAPRAITSDELLAALAPSGLAESIGLQPLSAAPSLMSSQPAAAVGFQAAAHGEVDAAAHGESRFEMPEVGQVSDPVASHPMADRPSSGFVAESVNPVPEGDRGASAEHAERMAEPTIVSLQERRAVQADSPAAVANQVARVTEPAEPATRAERVAEPPVPRPQEQPAAPAARQPEPSPAPGRAEKKVAEAYPASVIGFGRSQPLPVAAPVPAEPLPRPTITVEPRPSAAAVRAEPPPQAAVPPPPQPIAFQPIKLRSLFGKRKRSREEPVSNDEEEDQPAPRGERQANPLRSKNTPPVEPTFGTAAKRQLRDEPLDVPPDSRPAFVPTTRRTPPKPKVDAPVQPAWKTATGRRTSLTSRKAPPPRVSQLPRGPATKRETERRRWWVKADQGLIAAGVVMAFASGVFGIYMNLPENEALRQAGEQSMALSLSADQDETAANETDNQPDAANVDPVVTATISRPAIRRVDGEPPDTPAASTEAPERQLKAYRVRDVIADTALVEGPHGLELVKRGGRLEDGGLVTAIEKRDSKWVVATSEGVISDQ